MSARQTLLRKIPKVDRLLDAAPLAGAVRRYGRRRLAVAVRTVLEDLRQRSLDGRLDLEELREPAVVAEVELWLKQDARPYYRRVINGTGVVLHTGLGRVFLPWTPSPVSRGTLSG